MRNIKPPLPFVGHKGHWGNELAEIAHALPPGCTVFDVFGGSGICSEYIRRARPDLTVIWNDFDNYRARLEHVGDTERLRRFFLDALGAPAKKGSYLLPLDDARRALVFDTLQREEAERGFVDSVTISRWFYLYHNKAPKMSSGAGKLYNRVQRSPMRFDACAGWLSGAVRTSVCFTGPHTAFPVDGRAVRPCDFAESQNALLILDPPYLSTGCNDYGNRDSLFVLRHIVDCCDRLPFLLFGDLSISFWYDALFRGRHVRRYEKQLNKVGMNHETRAEVLFACLPGD